LQEKFAYSAVSQKSRGHSRHIRASAESSRFKYSSQAANCSSPDERLWRRLDLKQVQREISALMVKARAHGMAGIVQIDSRCTKAVEDLPLFQVSLGDILGLRHRGRAIRAGGK